MSNITINIKQLIGTINMYGTPKASYAEMQATVTQVIVDAVRDAELSLNQDNTEYPNPITQPNEWRALKKNAPAPK